MESSSRSDLRLNEDQKLKIYQLIQQLRRQLVVDNLSSHEAHLELWHKAVQNCQQQGLMKALYNSKLLQIAEQFEAIGQNKSARIFAALNKATKALFEF